VGVFGEPLKRDWYRILFENTSDAIVVAEADTGRVVDVNRTAEELWGYTKEEMVGMCQEDLHPPNLRGVYRLVLKSHITAPRTFMSRCVVLRKDGETRTAELRSTTLQVGDKRYVMGFFRDKTREIQALEEAAQLKYVELPRSRAVFEVLFQAFPEAVLVMDPSVPRFVMANQKAVEQYGYSAEEWTRIHPRDICPSWDEVRCQALLERCLAGMKVREEVWHLRKSGERFPVEVHLSCAEISGQRHLVAVAVDATEARRLMEELRRSEELYRETVNAIPDYLYKVKWEKGELKPELCTPAAEEITGYPPQAYLDDPWLWFKIIHPDDKPMVRALLARLFQGETVTGEFRVICKDGRVKWIRDSATPVLDGRGRIVGVTGVVSDITRAKEAEEELRRLTQELERKVEERTRALKASEQLYRNLVENALVGISQVDEEGRYTYANQAFLDLIGYSWEEVEGRFFADFVPQEHRGEMIEKFRERMEGKKDRETYETRLLNREGDAVEVLIAASLLKDLEGTHRGTIALVVDISAMKALERQLQMKIGELETFSYSVSHDLKAPLRALETFSHLLREEYGDRLDDRGREYLRHLSQAAVRMAILIDDLLQYSRVGRRGLHFQWVDLKEVVDEALEYLWEGIESREASVEVANSMPRVWGDKSTLVLLFTNLVSNALKFSKPQEPPRVRISWEERERSFCVTVSDNGIGIEPQHRERIFQVFQRLHTEEEIPGTGMGLAICKKVVEIHGGNIWVDSVPGEGSHFRFTLPKKKGGGR